MSDVPYTRSLPYVLREKLSAATRGEHVEGQSAGINLLCGRVVSTDPSSRDRLTVSIQGQTLTIPKLHDYAAQVGDACYILSAPLVTIAIGAVRT